MEDGEAILNSWVIAVVDRQSELFDERSLLQNHPIKAVRAFRVVAIVD